MPNGCRLWPHKSASKDHCGFKSHPLHHFNLHKRPTWYIIDPSTKRNHQVSIEQTLKSRFGHLVPGQVMVFSDKNYVAKPRSSTFFFIEDLDRIRAFLKNQGFKMTPRFRGPRDTMYNIDRNGKQYKRHEPLRQSVCLKEDAFFFTAYISSY